MKKGSRANGQDQRGSYSERDTAPPLQPRLLWGNAMLQCGCSLGRGECSILRRAQFWEPRNPKRGPWDFCAKVDNTRALRPCHLQGMIG